MSAPAPLPPGRTFAVKGKRGYLIDGQPVDLSVTDIIERGVPEAGAGVVGR